MSLLACLLILGRQLTVECCSSGSCFYKMRAYDIMQYLEQPGIPQRLSRQREKLLYSSRLFPHHELLGGRCEVKGGDDVRVVGQLGPDGLAVQLLHTVHNQLPLTLCFCLFHWRQKKRNASPSFLIYNIDHLNKCFAVRFYVGALCLYTENCLSSFNN